MQLFELLDEAIARGASDVHLVVGEPPVLRIDAALERTDRRPLTDADMDALLLPALDDALREQLSNKLDAETSLRNAGRLFRLHVFRERTRLGATVRLAPNAVPTIDALFGTDPFAETLRGIMRGCRGIVLVTGPSGSGKSTTCHALLEEVNRSRPARILTIEDPIEFPMANEKAVITQRTVGEDVATFSHGAVMAFRDDPDIVYISELRDLGTLQAVLALAESGHVVLSLMHVESAAESIARFVDVFPEPRDLVRRMLARNLAAVIAQRLLPRADGPGRVAVNEVLLGTERVRRMIADGTSDLTLAIEASRAEGMQTMDDAVLAAYGAGRITYEAAWQHVSDRTILGPKGK